MADPVTQIKTVPLFKGATRPACILGVPTETFVITVLTGMVISLLFWPPLMLLIPIPVWIFKRITDRDDQVLYQWGIYFRTMIQNNPNRLVWRNSLSLSPSNRTPRVILCPSDFSIKDHK